MSKYSKNSFVNQIMIKAPLYICLPRVQDIYPPLWLWDRTAKPYLLSVSMTVRAWCLVSVQPGRRLLLRRGGELRH